MPRNFYYYALLFAVLNKQCTQLTDHEETLFNFVCLLYRCRIEQIKNGLFTLSTGSASLGMPPDYMSVAASGFCPRTLSDLHPTSTLSSAELAFAFDSKFDFFSV